MESPKDIIEDIGKDKSIIICDDPNIPDNLKKIITDNIKKTEKFKNNAARIV